MADESTEETIRAEVAVLGGGLAGLSMAVVLADAGFETVCVDRDPPRVSPTGDGRTTALAPASQRLLERIGVWADLAPSAGPIREIRVADAASPLFLHFGAEERPAGEAGRPLGWIVDNTDLRRTLLARASTLANLRHLAPLGVRRLDAGTGGIDLDAEDGRRVRARLLIGADGRHSMARTHAGIPVVGHDYGQSAIVCTIGHANPHRGVALEHFLPSGPFAVLPMTGGRSSIVWSERRDLADRFLALPEAAFLEELRRRSGDWLGETQLLTRRAAWPLAAQLARRLTGERIALVGEAAHILHPVAGQGFNVSLRDVAALAEGLAGARRLGLDIGARDVLAGYERRRRFDTLAMAAACDGLVRLFSNRNGPLRLARDLGLAAVDRTGPAKRFFMAQAMGLRAPARLLRGEPV
jgi:2-octaprenyl-6-methoxyphenol hydroxylase